MSLPTLDRRSFAALASGLRQGRAALGRRIGNRLREEIILHVSAVNRCAVCSIAHGWVARAVGVGAEEIRAARGDAAVLDERARVALAYAALRTLGLEDGAPAEVAAFTAAFDAEEQREVRAVVDLFTFANRFNNTWEGLLPGAARRRRALGIGE